MSQTAPAPYAHTRGRASRYASTLEVGGIECSSTAADAAAVLERFGACCDSLVGFVNMLCGDGERDALHADDWTLSASSRTTYMASLLVFGTLWFPTLR